MFSVTKAAVLAADTILAVLCLYPQHKLSGKDSMQDRFIRASWVSKEVTAFLSITLVAWALIAQRSILWQPWTPASCLTAALAMLGLALRLWSMQVSHSDPSPSLPAQWQHQVPALAMVGTLLKIVWGRRSWASTSLSRSAFAPATGKPVRAPNPPLLSSASETQHACRLIKTGPYKIVRHPAYTGGAVGYIALAIFLQLPAVVTAGGTALLAAFGEHAPVQLHAGTLLGTGLSFCLNSRLQRTMACREVLHQPLMQNLDFIWHAANCRRHAHTQ